MKTLKFLLFVFFLLATVMVLLGLFLYQDSKPSEVQKAIFKARNIGMALKTYANEHDGKFPSGNTVSEVFSQLLPQEKGSGGYISDKRAFYVKGSKYTPGSYSEGTSPKSLGEGENHWGFMAGFSDSVNGRWPLFFEGPATPDGTYSSSKSEKGGLREGKGAVVVRLDGSCCFEALKDLRIQTDGQDNILKSSATWAVNGRLLMP